MNVLGKAQNIRIHTEYAEAHVNLWLADNPDVEIVTISLAVKPADQWHQEGEAFLIVYKEVEDIG